MKKIFLLPVLAKKLIHLFMLLLAVGLPGACRPTSANPSPSAATAVPAVLTPYRSATPRPDSPTAAPTSSPLPQPSPTPRIHSIQAGESLGTLSLRYGVSIAALLAANPEINPNAMSVGLSLVIPPAEQDAGSAASAGGIPLPTPLPVELSRPACYPAADGGAYCMLWAHNRLDTAIESVAAILRSQNLQNAIQEQAAFSALNRIPAGESGILTARLPATPQDLQAVDAALSSALPSPQDDRYPPLNIAGLNVQKSTDQRSAVITGQLVATGGAQPPVTLRVAAAALDSAGQLIGVRIWESQTEALPETGLEFQLTLYALSGEIDRVQVWAEALRR